MYIRTRSTCRFYLILHVAHMSLYNYVGLHVCPYTKYVCSTVSLLCWQEFHNVIKNSFEFFKPFTFLRWCYMKTRVQGSSICLWWPIGVYLSHLLLLRAVNASILFLKLTEWLTIKHLSQSTASYRIAYIQKHNSQILANRVTCDIMKLAIE